MPGFCPGIAPSKVAPCTGPPRWGLGHAKRSPRCARRTKPSPRLFLVGSARFRGPLSGGLAGVPFRRAAPAAGISPRRSHPATGELDRPRRCAPLCRAPTGRTGGGRRSKPSPRFFVVGDVRQKGRCTAEREEKQMAANRRFAAGDFGGKCERGLPPFTINNDHSELAAARRQRRARELLVPARSAGRFGRGAHLPTPLRRTTRQNQAPPFRTARPTGGSTPPATCGRRGCGRVASG